ncbi:MAG: hypothetical protein IJ995_01915 [Clostridia bacterium]|nr:hypothetical protein [Clostridia bacterium]
MLLYLLLSLPGLIITLIFYIQRKKRMQKISVDSDIQSYTCPMCRMENDTMKPCERCGFDPYTKKGGEDYVDEDLQKLDNIIRRAL